MSNVAVGPRSLHREVTEQTRGACHYEAWHGLDLRQSNTCRSTRIANVLVWLDHARKRSEADGAAEGRGGCLKRRVAALLALDPLV
jgi:hypothetical protein